MRYLHEEGTQTPFSYASEMIQNLANNEIRNATKIITLTPGFMPGSFEPEVIVTNPSEPSAFSLCMNAGAAIFPDGEVFIGNGYKCYVSIVKSDSAQYLKLVHQELKQDQTLMSSGDDKLYSEIYDGARLTLSPESSQSINELMIAKISFPPQAPKPEIEIISEEWKFYWSGAQIVDPNESTVLSMGSRELSLDSAHLTKCVPNAIDNPYSVMQRMGVSPIDGKYAWDVAIDSIDAALWGMNTRNALPHVAAPGALGQTVSAQVPAGIDFLASARKADAYRGKITTEWTVVENIIPGGAGDINISAIVHDNYPIVAIRVWSDDNLPTGAYAQVWLSESVEPDITATPPKFEIPIPAGEIPSLQAMPYYLFYSELGVSNVNIRYRIVTPDLKVTTPKAVSVDMMVSSAPADGDSMVHVPLGNDRSSAIDEDGVRLYYNKSTIKFYLPRSARRPGLSEDKVRRLQKIRFVNYRSAELGTITTHVATGGLKFSPSPLGALLKLTGNKADIDQTITAGDYINLRGSDDPDILPHGRYLVDTVSTTPYALLVSPLYPTALTGAHMVNLLDVHLDDDPLCRLSLYDISGEIDELVVGTGYGLYGGALPINPLAGYTGSPPVRSASFPESPYTNEVDFSVMIPGQEIVYLTEGRWYEFRLTKVSGEDDYFQANGHVDLWFTEE